MRVNQLLLIAVAASLLLVSCNKNNPDPEPVKTVGVFILNSGSFGYNNANLASYDSSTGEVQYEVFKKQNNKLIGDTGQDMLIFGSKMYIASSGSKVIFVTDHTAKIVKEITVSGTLSNLSPRYFTTFGDKVYVTYYEGYLGQIDTSSFAVTTVKVGDNPEQVTAANGKLYVANSGGLNYPNYGKTVSVVNPSSMSVTKTLNVSDNPQYILTDSQNDVYLISTGNYYDVPSKLQKINSSTDEVSVIDGVVPTWMARGANDKIYIVSSSYDANWNAVAVIYVYDAITDKIDGKFITDESVVDNVYSISADEVTGRVYIGTSDYVTTGDMYIYNSKGQFVNKFDTGGINPMGAYFLTNVAN